MEDNKKPVVLVLARNYPAGLGIVRSLGSVGYTVDLLATVSAAGKSAAIASSKYIRNSIEIISKMDQDGNDAVLVEAILKYAEGKEEKIILFPSDDHTAAVMDRNREALAPFYIMPSITSGQTLTEFMYREVQTKIAAEAGIPVPLEWKVSVQNKVEIPEDMVYPCYARTIEAAAKVSREKAECTDEDELRRFLEKVRRKFPEKPVLIQEFLEIDDEIEMSGVCLDQEVIIPAIIKRTGIAQYEAGITLTGKTMAYKELGDLQDKIKNMMKSYHYKGMFDLELHVVNGKLYFHKMSLRPSVLNYVFTQSGVNLPAIYAGELCGVEHASEEMIFECGKTFVYDRAAWKDHTSGFMNAEELQECIASADLKIVFDESDPAPGKVFTNKLKKIAVKTKIKEVLRPVKHYLLGYPQMKKKNQRDPKAEKPRVLVVGRNYCSNLCIARALGFAGYEVEIMRIFQRRPKRLNLIKALKPDAYSKYVKAFHVCVSRRSVRIVDRLKKIADLDNKMLLIGADDFIANIVDTHLEELSEYYILANVDNKEGELSRLMSKAAQKELALAAGLPVLNSCVIKSEDEVFEIPETVTYPCFIKPNISKNGSKTKMRRCDSEQELRETLTGYCEKSDFEMLVEDFVEIGREHSILGLSTKEGAIGPGFFRAEEGGQNEQRGVALIGQVRPCSEQQQLIDDIVKFIGTLRFEGLYDVDLIETVDGKFYFVELNLRFGGSGYAITASDMNLPGMFADYMLLGKPIDMNCKLENPGKRFASEKIMIEEYIKGRIPKSKFKNTMKDVDIHFIECKEDMRPYRHFMRYFWVATLFRNYYKLRDKFSNKE